MKNLLFLISLALLAGCYAPERLLPNGSLVTLKGLNVKGLIRTCYYMDHRCEILLANGQTTYWYFAEMEEQILK